MKLRQFISKTKNNWLKTKPRTKWIGGLAAGFGSIVALSSLVFAAQTVNWVSLNNGTNWTNSTNGQVVYITSTSPSSDRDFNAKINVTLSSNDDWKCTTTKIEGQDTETHNTSDKTSNGTHENTVTLRAPSSNGKYDITFKIYESGSSSCSGDNKEFKINDAVIVDTTNPSNANPSSTSHTVNVPKNDSTIDMSWPAVGASGGASDSTSGVAGYSYSFTSSSSSDAPSTKNLNVPTTSVTSSTLADGTYYFHFRTFDKAGNKSSTVHKGPYIIDTVAPGTPSGLKFEHSGDSLGCSASNYTKQTSLRANWDNASGSPSGYEIERSGPHPYSTNVQTTGSSQYDWSLPNVDGTYTFKVRSVDGAGNKSSYSSTCSITLDKTDPSVNAGQNRTVNSSFTQSDATASDATSGIQSYSWTKESGPSGGTVTITTSNILKPSFSANKDGTYKMKLTVTDKAGNSKSDEFTFVWDTTPPSVPSGLHFENGSGDNIGCGIFTKSQNRDTDWSSSSGDPVNYEIERSGPSPFSTTTNTTSSSRYDWTLPGVDGTYSFKVRAVDSVGNWSEWSSSCSITLDQTDPTVDAGQDRHVNTSFTQSDATASDATSGIDGYSWTQEDGPGTVTITTDDILNPSFSASEDGVYTLRLTVTDNAGNSSHDEFTLTWDTTAGEINIDTHPNFLSNDNTPSFTFSVSNEFPVEETLTIECRLDSGAWEVCESPLDLEELGDGWHLFSVRVTDVLGNSDQDSYVWRIDTTAPSVPTGLHFEFDGDNLGCGGYTNQNALRTDWNTSSGLPVGYEIELSGPEPFETVVVSSVILSRYDWTLPEVDGIYKFRVKSVDLLGNTSGYSTQCSITLDQTNPEVDAGANVDANAEFEKEDATASDATSGIASYSWTQESGPGTVTIDTDSELNPSFSADTDGTYVLELTVTDNAGNSSSDSFTLLWDTTVPEISFDDFPDALSNNASPSFSFSATDLLSEPVTFQCKLDSGVFASCTSPKALSGLSDGEHTFTVKAIDALGNEVEDSYTWVVDTTPPVITRLGSSPVTVTVGQPYVDAGATASDNHDGDITEDIVTNNGVNSAITGSYTVTYNVSDAAGNAATQVSRTVIIADDDGVDDETENNAPNSGDANNDNTPDSQQPNVTSFVNPVTSNYAVLDNLSQCDNNHVEIVAAASLPTQDPGFDYPAGLMNFTLNCGEDNPGITVTVVQYYYGVDAADLVARKYNNVTETFQAIPDATIENVTIGDQPAAKLSYPIKDGGELDEDGIENGTIVDPSGLANVMVGAPNTGLGGQAVGVSTSGSVTAYFRRGFYL